MACVVAFAGDQLQCGRCHHLDDEEQRERGCTADLPDGAEIEVQPCPHCSGADPGCGVCSGTNRWPLRRCPGALLDLDAIEAVRVAMQAIEHHVLPAAGGMSDQAWRFPLVVEHVHARYLEAQRDVQERERERMRRESQPGRRSR